MPIKHQFVLTATIIHIHDRQLRLGYPLLQNVQALLMFINLIGGRVQRNDPVNLLRMKALQWLLMPKVFTNEKSDAVTLPAKNTVLVTRNKIPLFIKYAILRQALLMIAREALAAMQHRDTIK